MSKPIRFASAISLVALASVIGGCAAPQRHASSASSRPSGEIGLATRALAALAANDPATAVDFAEQAAARDAARCRHSARCSATAYFAGGRFASAEAAFKDSLSLDPNQPQVVLKLALAEIAQGKNGEAIAILDAGRGALDPADYGLALALAGRPLDAIAALEPAARGRGCRRPRPPEPRARLCFLRRLDQRQGGRGPGRSRPTSSTPACSSGCSSPTPARPSDQVAALTGVTPAAADPGQPVQLALRQADSRLAEAAPAPAPVPPQAAPAPPPSWPKRHRRRLRRRSRSRRATSPMSAPVAAADVPSVPAFTPEVHRAAAAVARPARIVHAKLPKASVRRATGKSGAVVQLGALRQCGRGSRRLERRRQALSER